MDVRIERRASPAGPSELRRAAGAGRLLALFDAARSGDVLAAIERTGAPRRCLYQGEAALRFAGAAPYLVELDDDRALAALIERGWGRAWGVFLTSTEDPEVVRSHLRHFLFVHDEASDSNVYFRFYDPRVLRGFLPLTTPAQRAALFARVTSFVLEDDQGAMLACTRDAQPADAARAISLGADQSRALQEASFEGRVVAYLRDSFANAADLPADALATFTRALVARGRRHGFVRERQLVDFVAVAWIWGAAFDRQFPEISRALSAPTDADRKHQALRAWAEQKAADEPAARRAAP